MNVNNEWKSSSYSLTSPTVQSCVFDDDDVCHLELDN